MMIEGKYTCMLLENLACNVNFKLFIAIYVSSSVSVILFLQSVAAAHPHAAASWHGRAPCPAAERTRRHTS